MDTMMMTYLIEKAPDKPCRKRNRTQNWTEEEKWFLLHQVATNHNAITSKDDDRVSAQQRAQAWDRIMDQYNTTFGTSRNLVRVKEQWKRMKIAARQETKDPGLQPSEMTTYVKDLLAAVNKRPNVYYEETGPSHPQVSVSENAMMQPTHIKIEALDPDVQPCQLRTHTEDQEHINSKQHTQSDPTATIDSLAHSHIRREKVTLEQPKSITQSQVPADSGGDNQTVISDTQENPVQNTPEIKRHLNEPADDKDKTEYSIQQTGPEPFPVGFLVNPQSAASNLQADKQHDSPKPKKFKRDKVPQMIILPLQSPTTSRTTSEGGKSPAVIQMLVPPAPITITTCHNTFTETVPVTTTFTESSTHVSKTSKRKSTKKSPSLKPEHFLQNKIIPIAVEHTGNSGMIGTKKHTNPPSEAIDTTNRSRVSALLQLKQKLLEDSISYALEEHALRKQCIMEEHKKKLEVLDLEKQAAMAKINAQQARLNVILADENLDGQV